MQIRRLATHSLADVEVERQRWLYEDLIPLGASTVLAGRGGIGKSTILAWLAASATRGTLPGDLYGQPVDVAFIAAEDHPATVLVPRLKAADADLARTHDLSRVQVIGDRAPDSKFKSAADSTAEVLAKYGVIPDGATGWETLPTIADDLPAIESALAESGARLLIVDPVISMMDGDQIKARDVRRNLDPLNALAQRLDVAIVLVMHFNKGGGSASDRVSGSHAFRDAARAVLLLAVDDETDQRVLTMDKGNTTPRSMSLAFEIDDALVAARGGDAARVGRARLIGETSTTVHQIVSRENDRALGDLSSRIVALVNGSAEPMSPSDVAEALGENYDTVKRYLGRLVNSQRIARRGRGLYAPIAGDSEGDTVSRFTEVSLVSPVSPPESGKGTEGTEETRGHDENRVSPRPSP